MALHVAAVYAADGIRLLTAAATGEAVMARVAEYVERNADLLLWPEDAKRMRELIAGGKLRDAIALYFARVGERWEREYLRIEVVESSGLNATAAPPAECRRRYRSTGANASARCPAMPASDRKAERMA